MTLADSASHAPPVAAIVIGALLTLAMTVPATIAALHTRRARRRLRTCPRCGSRAVCHAAHERVTVLTTRVVLQCGQCATRRRVVVNDTDRQVQFRRLARDQRRMRRGLLRLEAARRASEARCAQTTTRSTSAS